MYYKYCLPLDCSLLFSSAVKQPGYLPYFPVWKNSIPCTQEKTTDFYNDPHSTQVWFLQTSQNCTNLQPINSILNKSQCIIIHIHSISKKKNKSMFIFTSHFFSLFFIRKKSNGILNTQEQKEHLPFTIWYDLNSPLFSNDDNRYAAS